jgi:extradiol dioxygenase family protein
MGDLLQPFHLALPVNDLDAASDFYCGLLGCETGRTADRLEQADCEFLITPRIRFKGETGEQATMFLHDPSGNALEFKSFADAAQLFAT